MSQLLDEYPYVYIELLTNSCVRHTDKVFYTIRKSNKWVAWFSLSFKGWLKERSFLLVNGNGQESAD